MCVREAGCKCIIQAVLPDVSVQCACEGECFCVDISIASLLLHSPTF